MTVSDSTTSEGREVERVVIVGGGTAGWMAAAALSRFLDNGRRQFHLVESEAIGTVGVGEATIPPILNFNRMLDINENEFLRETQGTIKLGIEFVNWGRIGDRYTHPFGFFGQELHGIAFHQLWLREQGRGNPGYISDYCMSAVAAANGRFGRPSQNTKPPVSEMLYAFHFDASLYARYLRGRAEKQGVRRHEGRIVQVHRDSELGDVRSVELESGERIEGDLFIDCSGFRALLIGETLGVGYEDWSQWLPVDRAIPVPTTNIATPDPFTRATAHSAGWQWRIPLQHRTGNGHVYCSAFMDDDEAERILMANLEGEPFADRRVIRFTTGRRKQSWSHNVIALGLSSGFLEPLESTSIHLIQNGIQRLLALFPDRQISSIERDEYNRGMQDLYEDIRDFIILHYKATQRDDTPFWRHVRDMAVPETLTRKLELWRLHGRVFREGAELFGLTSWVAVLLGQNIWPDTYEPIVDTLDEAKVAVAFKEMRERYYAAAMALPSQEEFLRMAGAWAAQDVRPQVAAAQ
ncbi:tryptophan halogenase family protein [Altererythrobacter sp. Root672]|uniref:tryptophan halogenase family protein n=1 Tax=Altererythrobacter sp. Root672 TaxID=1736584 RepID=UPI0006FBA2FB|nr:tryptophan halogenase family protein [Altererythrobacter sp. Root672]KRA80594.1 tryptophan halogenase [Altererythrobacter sp. Root672]